MPPENNPADDVPADKDELEAAMARLVGTKLHPGPFDCYAKAEPDEPMFILLARDKYAPGLVWLWSVLRELDGDDPAKLKDARERVASMVLWAADHGRKSAGVAQPVLAGVFEMIRVINHHQAKDAKNDETTLEDMRRFLCAAKFEPDPAPPAGG
jgi:hypothetical protein